MLLSVLYSLSPISSASAESAREDFQFSVGDKVRILSDKAFRRTRDQTFDAVGNVIINQGDNAIYGEKAKLNMLTGESEVVGNVRYIGPTMTMYGSQMGFNFRTGRLEIKNARIISDNYVVLGSEFVRESPELITGKDAEYTTCRDCPESWSIFGRNVQITPGQYIRIKHAYIKVRGVVVMYVPYIVLPIKKDRETGLLFPNISLDLEKGLRIQQPWYWAISDQSDMTVTPSLFGKRGWGGDLEYRQMLGEKKWFEVHTLQSLDQVYEVGKKTYDKSASSEYRTFGNFEQHFTFGNTFNHHFAYSMVNDLDMFRDFDFYTDRYLEGGEIGGSSFVEWRTPFTMLGVEGHFNRNLIFADAKGFDHQYVQILPKLKFETTPFTLLESDYFGMRAFSTGFDGDFTIFKQNHVLENTYIRNAHRTNLAPYVNWNLGHLGPLQFQTTAKLDLQNYHFPNETTDNSFQKRAVLYESEISFELEKVFGVAYNVDMNLDELPARAQDEYVRSNQERFDAMKIKRDGLVGDLPLAESSLTTEKIEVSRNAYRHSQIIKLKHYYLGNEEYKGSQKFYDQIQQDAGRFDERDAVRANEYTGSHVSSRTSLPLSNTLELQWNHSLIRKSPKTFDPLSDGHYLRDHFNYSRVAYFNLSQGLDMATPEESFEGKLTRLAVSSGISVANGHLSAYEYYYYATNEHVFGTSYQHDFGRVLLKASFTYDAFTRPIDKYGTLEGQFELSDLIALTTLYDYNWETKKSERSKFGIIYSPANNCWMVGLDYEINQIDRRFAFNFLINFNEDSFQGMKQ